MAAMSSCTQHASIWVHEARMRECDHNIHHKRVGNEDSGDAAHKGRRFLNLRRMHLLSHACACCACYARLSWKPVHLPLLTYEIQKQSLQHFLGAATHHQHWASMLVRDE
eukprot:scaffold327804_cov52-Tisochrysis_lutea.AAC.1